MRENNNRIIAYILAYYKIQISPHKAEKYSIINFKHIQL